MKNFIKPTFFIFFVITSFIICSFTQKALAQSVCNIEGGSCIGAGLCGKNCSSCTSVDQNGNTQCSSGVCCDPTQDYLVCNSTPLVASKSYPQTESCYSGYSPGGYACYQSSCNYNCIFAGGLCPACTPGVNCGSSSYCAQLYGSGWYYNSNSSYACLPNGYPAMCCMSGGGGGTPPPPAATPTPACPSHGAVSFNPNPGLMKNNLTATVTVNGAQRVDYTVYAPDGSVFTSQNGNDCSGTTCTASWTPNATGTWHVHFNAWSNSCLNNPIDGYINVIDPCPSTGTTNFNPNPVFVTDSETSTLYVNGAQEVDYSVYDPNGNLFKSQNGNDCSGTTCTASWTPNIPGSWHLLWNAWAPNCNPNYINAYVTANSLYTIQGSVYLDNDNNGTYDPGVDTYANSIPGYSNVTEQLSWNGGNRSSQAVGNSNLYVEGNLHPNTYTLTFSQLPAGYGFYNNVNTAIVPITNANKTQDIPIVPIYDLSGNVFIDYNDAQKPDYAPVKYVASAGTVGITQNGNPVKDQNGNTINPITIDNTGTFDFGTALFAGTYTVTFTPSSSLVDSYTTTTPKVFTVTVGNGCAVGGSLTASCIGGSIQNLGFGMTPYYTVSGIIYDDLNLDQYYTPLDQKGNIVDTPITTGTVTATGPMNATATITTSGATKGNYVFSGHTNGLIRGTYTLTYNPVGTNQAYSYPPNYQVQVTVGMPGISSIAPCDASNGHNYDNQDSGGVIHHYLSVCDTNGNIVMTGNPFGDGRDLNFGINDTETSTQTTCGDIRVTGLTDHLPATGTCGGVSNAYASVTDSTMCPNSPGIAFCQNQSCDFGNGSASVNNWQVGSTTDPEVFQPINACVIRTSTQYLTDTASQNGIQTTPLTTICPNLSDCILPGNLANGIYTANSDVTMEGYTFSSTARVAFIINGNLTITGNIIVPVGGVAAFSASGNIYIDKSVGVSDPSIICDPSTQIGCNIEGLFSAGNQIIVESARTSPTQACNFDGTSQDLRINFAGSFVTGANCTNATITNQRDLCKADTTCPVQMITQRGDMLLNAYSFNFLLHENSAWKEVNP